MASISIKETVRWWSRLSARSSEPADRWNRTIREGQTCSNGKVRSKKEKMWYVIWTYTGREEYTRSIIEKKVPKELYGRISIPYRAKIEKAGGSRRVVHKLMIPSYIFVETDCIRDFHEALGRIPVFSIILRNGEKFLPLDEHDEFVLNKLTSDGDIIDMSTGFMDGDRVRVASGPLKGLDGSIKKIYPRKALAVIEMTVFSRITEVQLGLEILKKTE